MSMAMGPPVKQQQTSQHEGSAEVYSDSYE